VRNKSFWTLRNILITVLLFAVLVSGVFAWIYGNVSPEITGHFKIGNMTGLNFVLDTDTKTNLINLNDALGITVENLNLNESSSVDGAKFVTRDTEMFYMESGVTNAKEVLTFRPSEINYVALDENNNEVVCGDYMDISFRMLVDYAANTEGNNDYYIYFLNGSLDNAVYSTGFKKTADTSMQSNGLRALRACLRVTGATNYGPAMKDNTTVGNDLEHWAIFGNESELGTGTSPYQTSAIAQTEAVGMKSTAEAEAVSEDICGSYTLDYLTNITQWPHTFGTTANVTVNSFADNALNPAQLQNVLTGNTVPSDNYLFKLDSDNHSVEMTLRVWLEGGSDFCVNGQVVPNDAIALNLFFVAYTVSNNAG